MSQDRGLKGSHVFYLLFCFSKKVTKKEPRNRYTARFRDKPYWTWYYCNFSFGNPALKFANLKLFWKFKMGEIIH